MMSEYIPLTELWTFIYGKLSGVISCSVYDFVPEEIVYPYVIFGEETVVPNRTKQNVMFVVTTLFHIYSEYKGRKEVIDISNEILNILTNRTNVFNKSFPGNDYGVKVSELSDSVGFTNFTELDADTKTTYRHGILGIEWLIY